MPFNKMHQSVDFRLVPCLELRASEVLFHNASNPNPANPSPVQQRITESGRHVTSRSSWDNFTCT